MSHSEAYKDAFYAVLRKRMEAVSVLYKPVLFGDFNASVGLEAHGSGWRCIGPAVDDRVSQTSSNRH